MGLLEGIGGECENSSSFVYEKSLRTPRSSKTFTNTSNSPATSFTPSKTYHHSPRTTTRLMRAQPVVPMMLAMVLDDICCDLEDSLSRADQDEVNRCCVASNSAIRRSHFVSPALPTNCRQPSTVDLIKIDSKRSFGTSPVVVNPGCTRSRYFPYFTLFRQHFEVYR